MDMLQEQFNKLTPVAPPEDVMRPWRTPSPRTRYRLHHRCRWTEIARQLMDPGQGVSCWAKHCADPAPDRHTVGAAEISPAQDSGRPPTGLECKFLQGSKIPHAICENTTREKSTAQGMCKKCTAWRQGLVKIRHGGHLSRGKANDSRIGRKMFELVPRLGENLTRAGRQPSGKQL